MPIPQENENREDFVSRCIPIVLEEGTVSSNDQAVAICNSIYEESKKSVYKGLVFKTKKRG